MHPDGYSNTGTRASDYGSSQPTYSSYGQLFQPYPHYVNYDPNLYTHRRIDDDDFEPPHHST